MKRISPGLIGAIVLCSVWAGAFVVVLFRGTEAVQRELLLVLGIFSLALAAATAAWAVIQRWWQRRNRATQPRQLS